MLPKLKIHTPSVIALLLYLAFVLGHFYSEKLWGFHFTAFLLPQTGFFFLAIPALLIVSSFVVKSPFENISKEADQSIWNIVRVIFILLFGFLFLKLPLVNDFYGNSRGFIPILNDQIKSLPENLFSQLFSLEFKPGQGRDSVKLIIDLISFGFGVSIKQAFILLNTFFGLLYVTIWLYAVSKYIRSLLGKITWSLIGLTSPLLLIYFGHIETYAPVYLPLLIWLVVFLKQVETKQKRPLIWLFLILLIGFKFHTLFILLLPALLVSTFRTFFPDFKPEVFRFKRIITIIFIPILCFGILAYFFIFNDHVDPRTLQNFEDIDRLFLPLFSPASPLDKYNLFSWNHILDYINIFFLWSPAILLSIILAIYYWRYFKEDSMEINMLVLTALIFLAFLFAINPLFSMPMDWDLFMFPVPVLLALGLVSFSKISPQLENHSFILSSCALSILCIPAFMVLTTKEANSHRVEKVGIHIYKTYYEHASTYILYALNESNSLEEFLSREDKVIKQLEPFALKGNDKQYADLLLDQAINTFQIEKNPLLARKIFLQSIEYSSPDPRFSSFIHQVNQELNLAEYPSIDRQTAENYTDKGKAFLKDSKDYAKALELFTLASYYNPLDKRNTLFRLEALFSLKQFKAAYHEALKLIELKHLDDKKAQRIAIHTALEAELYSNAQMHCEKILNQYPDDSFTKEIHSRLINRDRVKELKLLFRRGE